MAIIRLNTVITSNTAIISVKIISIKFNEENILQSPVSMNKYNNIYFADVNIPDKYLNREMKYEIEIIDRSPANVPPNPPENLTLYNRYVIGGNLFVYSPTIYDYKYVKRMFVNITGRHDLVTNPMQDDYSDPTGQLNFLFNSAQRWLDEKADVIKFIGYIYKELPANDKWISFDNVRYVKKIYEILDDKTLVQIPFVITTTCMIPEQLGNTLTTEQKNSIGLPSEVYSEIHYPTRIVYINPENRDRKLLVECYYYSKKLEQDHDVSFWTMQAPELLVKTVYMKLNEFYNNIEHANYLRQDIIQSVIEIRNNYIAEMWENIPSYCMKLEGDIVWQQ